MAPGPRNKLCAPIFEFEVFRMRMRCIEESNCDVVGAFRRPPSDSATGELSLCQCVLFQKKLGAKSFIRPQFLHVLLMIVSRSASLRILCSMLCLYR